MYGSICTRIDMLDCSIKLEVAIVTLQQQGDVSHHDLSYRCA